MERLTLTWQTPVEQHQVWHRSEPGRGWVDTVRLGRLIRDQRWLAEWQGEDAYVYDVSEHGKRKALAKVNEWMALMPGQWEAM